MNQHHFAIRTTWTGNTGQGTANYRAYKRDHEIAADGKSAPILGSSDPAFRGDRTRYNPEEMLIGALSSCHMLWLLHLCADAGIVVTEYTDRASGTMALNADGGGHFTEVTLRPRIAITDIARAEEIAALDHRAGELCFIAKSVNFPVHHAVEVVAHSSTGFALSSQSDS